MLRELGYVAFLTLFVIPLQAQVPPALPSSEKSEKNAKLPPCRACRVLVNSFEDGMRKTERNKHDGGDAAWEEERLGSYKTSEVRLVEIQESLCNDVTRGSSQCHNLAEDNEHLIEEWWVKHQTEEPDLFQYLCIDQLAVCCPNLHFGPNCEPCSDCHGNGQCKGNGTRKGNGKCLCDAGYAGEACTECALQYYEAFRDESKILCSPCHVACLNGTGCRGAGPRNCNSCAKGWATLSGGEKQGCIDVNECLEVRNACQRNQFCVNTEGSHTCINCDRSCNGCSGDGPDLCNTCADGYELRDGLCTDTAGEKREHYVTMTRYLTYLGLCIATCVIFQSSTWIASLVGLAVALYISVSEYWLSGSTTKGTSPTIPDHLMEELRGK
ncbi:cysteine-rich with EGF-like domain protein 2 [Sergentomyia squamirostris]